MIVEQVEAFKTWLTAVLKPMCDADPAALAKYVLALIKKDKSGDELHKMMVDQLEVFLENETESFVNLVLRTLESQEYITTPLIPNANPPNPLLVKKEVKPPVALPVETPLPPPPIADSTVNNGAPSRPEIVPKRPEREPRKAEVSDLNKRARHRSSSRNRSRSRSWDRSKRSKSRDRDSHREKRERPRAWRNKSPPTRRYPRRSRTPSPARGRSPQHRPRYRNRSPASRSRSRSRTPDNKRALNKERDSRPSTPNIQEGHLAAALNNSSSSAGSQSVRSVVVQGAKTRCRDFDEQGYCMRGEMCPYDHGVDPVVLEDSALSSVLTYNPNSGPPGDGVPPLQGHPLMGPRGLGSEYNPQAPQMYHRGAGGFRGGPRPPMGLPRGPMMGGFANQANLQQRELIPVPVMDNKGGVEYPGGPMMAGPYRFQSNYAGNVGGGGGGGVGDLISQPPPPYHQHQHHLAHPPPPLNTYNINKKPFDFARLGPRSGGGGLGMGGAKNPQNCSLELKKIPQGLNTITHLNNHFSKFGKPVNIQVSYEGDPEAAIVTFSSHAEANAAYRSTEAVLNNRFIKVFWHNATSDGKHQENVPPSARSIKDRLGHVPAMVPPNTNKVLNLVQPRADNNHLISNNNNNESAEEKSGKIKEEMKAQATAAIQKNQELLAAKEKLKKNQDEQRKEVMKIKQDLSKRKQELLERQLSQQKILIDKTKNMPPGPQRDLIIETMKKTQESIEAIKKDLLQSVTAAKNTNTTTVTPKKSAKDDFQRELLDAELDLITKQQEGEDTTEIQRKLYELKARAAMINASASSISGISSLGRGRGGRSMATRRFHPFSRHLLTKNNLVGGAGSGAGGATAAGDPSKAKVLVAAAAKHTVDHRPTRLLVSGYETEEQDSVLKHFQSYGEVVDYSTDATLPSITLNYKTRKDAEMALIKGKHFQDRTLSVTWCLTPTIALSSQIKSATKKMLLSESEEDLLIDQGGAGDAEEDLGPELSEEALLQDDEEEEDEGEDRSWRR